MTETALIILLLKIGLVSGLASIALWIGVYTSLARWWTSPIGRTLVAKSALLAALLVPSTLSLFFNLSRTDSRVVAWADVVLIGAIAPVMTWRTLVWVRLSRKGRHVPGNGDGDGAS